MSILDMLEKNLEEGKEAMKRDQSRGGGKKLAVGLEIRGRLLPYMKDGSCRFVETFYHHSFQQAATGEWTGSSCPKNGGWEEVCDMCDAMRKHYQDFGSDSIYDNYKRKRRYWSNFYVISVSALPGFTPDQAVLDAWKESIGKVTRVELPYTVKQKIDEALEDPELGTKIFNPVNGFDIRIKVTEKKTEDKAYPNYDSTGFAREMSPLPGVSTKEQLEAILGKCEDLHKSIDDQTQSDRSKMAQLSAQEGFAVGGNGPSPVKDSGKGNPPPSSSNNAPLEGANSSSSAPLEGANSSSAPLADPTPTPAETGGLTPSNGSSGMSLSDIFNSYRKE